MMMPEVTNWKPVDIESIQNQLGTFHAWCLCSGQSLDWMLGRRTRDHGDTDIGVLRSDLLPCLKAIGAARVFLCDPPGTLTPWDGGAVPERVHDIFVADEVIDHWMIQIMVFDEDADQVVYRRDPRIRWAKASHAITVRGIPVLNPLVTLLFKLNKTKLEDKDCRDMTVLIEELANRGFRDNGANRAGFGRCKGRKA